MPRFDTKHLHSKPDAVATDGSDVRILLRLSGGSMAHFELPPGETSTAVALKTTEEIWFFLSGRGEMWREQDGESKIVDVFPGVCITVPQGTRFQFRSFGYEPLAAVGVTMPPYPPDTGEDYKVSGTWEPTVPRAAP